MTDNGRSVRYIGAGGHTFTGDNDLGTDGAVIVFNIGGGNLTLASSALLLWLNGSGVVTSGSRTLATGGIVTMYRFGASGNYYVYGTGLS